MLKYAINADLVNTLMDDYMVKESATFSKAAYEIAGTCGATIHNLISKRNSVDIDGYNYSRVSNGTYSSIMNYMMRIGYKFSCNDAVVGNIHYKYIDSYSEEASLRPYKVNEKVAYDVKDAIQLAKATNIRINNLKDELAELENENRDLRVRLEELELRVKKLERK